MMRQTHRTLRFRTQGYGTHEITGEVRGWLDSIEGEDGLVSLFIRHTSASLTIMENADPDVMRDLSAFLARLVPEDGPYIHDAEGPDDMPAHLKPPSRRRICPFPSLAGGWGSALGRASGFWSTAPQRMNAPW